MRRILPGICRNLLLLKTSDNIEDVLDVSTENMAQLKEEAQMIDTGYAVPVYPDFLRTFRTVEIQLPRRELCWK